MSSADFKLSQISHVMLGVSKLAPAIAFYRDALGLAMQHQFEGFAFFAAGSITLALSEGLAQARPEKAGAVEIVFGVDDVRAAHAALAARGVGFTQEPRNVTGAMWAANFADPDGHLLSIFGPEHK